MDKQKETGQDTVLLAVRLDDADLRYVMDCAGLNNPDGAGLVRAVHHFLVEVARTSAVPVNFCSRCGKRLSAGVHTCTPPTGASA